MQALLVSRRKKQIKRVEGFTLVETILYLALFAIIFFTVMQFVLAIAENNRKAMARTRVETSLLFLLEHIEESFDNVDSISEAGSVFGNDFGVLQLSHFGIVRQYSVSSGRIMYNTGGVSVPVTPPDVIVTAFYLEKVGNEEGILSGVRITIEITTEEQDAIETIETAYTL